MLCLCSCRVYSAYVVANLGWQSDEKFYTFLWFERRPAGPYNCGEVPGISGRDVSGYGEDVRIPKPRFPPQIPVNRLYTCVVKGFLKVGKGRMFLKMGGLVENIEKRCKGDLLAPFVRGKGEK